MRDVKDINSTMRGLIKEVVSGGGVQPANHPQAMTLAHVGVGQLVWLESNRRSDRAPERRLIQISYKDKKSRLYICEPGPGRTDNWRYGFDPFTGKSECGHYKGETMSYASFASIEAEHERIRAAERVAEDEALKAAAIAKVRDAAPLMAKALFNAVHALKAANVAGKSLYAADVTRQAEEALEAAGLTS